MFAVALLRVKVLLAGHAHDLSARLLNFFLDLQNGSSVLFKLLLYVRHCIARAHRHQSVSARTLCEGRYCVLLLLRLLSVKLA